MYDFNKVPPKPDLGPALKQPGARLHAVLGADIVLHVLAYDERPVCGLPVPDVDRGRLVGVPVESDGEDLALVARDVLCVEADVTWRRLGRFNMREYWGYLLAITAAD